MGYTVTPTNLLTDTSQYQTFFWEWGNFHYFSMEKPPNSEHNFKHLWWSHCLQSFKRTQHLKLKNMELFFPSKYDISLSTSGPENNPTII